MSLHSRESIRPSINDDVYASSDLAVVMPKYREKEDLPKELVFEVNYLGGNMATFALDFSRPGGQVVAQYYNFLRLGRDGYRKIQQACADTGAFIAAEVVKLGPFVILYDGRGGIPGAVWTPVQRVLVRHGVSRDLGAALVADIRDAVEHFRRHPISAPLTAAEASGFHH
jgi:glutamate decarboxylase